MAFPSDVVLRVNMAWVDSLEKLESTLSKSKLDFFIDFPSGRMKPPNNKYEMSSLIPIFKKYKNVRYLAISNVESEKIILEYLNIIPNSLSIVPKIETIKGVQNIEEISKVLRGEKYVMLDHDDLFVNVMQNGKKVKDFVKLVDVLVSFSSENDIKLLRTRGVIFSDDI